MEKLNLETWETISGKSAFEQWNLETRDEGTVYYRNDGKFFEHIAIWDAVEDGIWCYEMENLTPGIEFGLVLQGFGETPEAAYAAAC